MAISSDRWIFSAEAIEKSPSRLDGVDAETELNRRQSTAMFIHELGCKLKV